MKQASEKRGGSRPREEYAVEIAGTKFFERKGKQMDGRI